MLAPFGTLGYGLTVTEDKTGHHPPLSTGAIIAIACAVAAVTLLVAAILVYCLCCKTKRRAELVRAHATPALAAIRVDVHERSGAGSDAPGRSAAVVVISGVHSGEGAVRLDCGHTFHQRCIRPWMQQNQTCPVCNTTHIMLVNPEATGIQFQPPRLSADIPAGRDDDLTRICRSSSSRF